MVGMGGTGAIGEVREGMRVVDTHGDEVGSVEEIRMSDPGSVTADTGTDAPGVLGALGDALVGGDGLPGNEQRRLARLGYIRIDAHGLFAGDKYAAADEIAGVTGDEVRLSVPKERLVG